MSGEPQQYDSMAIKYAADNAINPFNAAYERPATISLLGEVDGRRVLEAGCGAGPLTTWLVDHGAAVTAFDVSPEMVALARKALDGRARVLVADLTGPLEFAEDRSFDIVVASLVLHYVQHWAPVFEQFHRILVPGGLVVFSTHHPTMDWKHNPDNYFAVKKVTERWHKSGNHYDVTFWRRPLTAMTEVIATAGFVIEQLVEPAPLPQLQDADPAVFQQLATEPRFLFFRLRA